MELVDYNEQEKTATIRISDWDMLAIGSVLLGILNTPQDYAILGVPKARLEEIKSDLDRILKDSRSPRQAVDA